MPHEPDDLAKLDLNPYATYGEGQVDEGSQPREYEIASGGQRFANFLIDRLIFMVLTYGLGTVLAMTFIVFDLTAAYDAVFGDTSSSTPIGYLIGGLVAGGYYFCLEALTGRTIGKLVTGTCVVSESGGSCRKGQIFARTLSRFIPFEAFSFLRTPVGWHDTISKTRVVRISTLRPRGPQSSPAA